MSSSTSVAVGTAVPVKRKSRMPARLDFLQSASGLALGLFMWGHMFFVSSILLGKDAMWTITRFFEGYFFFGRAYPGIVSVVVATILVLFVGTRSWPCASSRSTTRSGARFARTWGT
jgi:fumarate reductase subunit C